MTIRSWMLAMAMTVGSAGVVPMAHAATFTETTDAGETLSTASYTGTGASAPLTSIFGSFGTESDADLYEIIITTPSSFSASTLNSITETSGVDTALFLLNAQGVAVATNDDAAGGQSIDSSLPAGNGLYANLAAGTYFLGVSDSGDEPVNLNNQLLFAGYPGGDTTAVRGAAGGLNPTTEAGFNHQQYSGAGVGAYEIDLTSSATVSAPGAVSAAPEPSAWALMIAGVALAGGALRYRRRPARFAAA